jgi:hypothetical protein
MDELQPGACNDAAAELAAQRCVRTRPSGRNRQPRITATGCLLPPAGTPETHFATHCVGERGVLLPDGQGNQIDWESWLSREAYIRFW